MSYFKIKDGIAIIPEGTTEIKVSVFAGCTSLESVVIPVGVTEIGEHAFKDCTSLTTVILPFSVNKIGKDTFKECSALTTIYVPADKVDHYKKCLPVDLHGKIAPAGDMKWDEAIREVLADNGAPMRLVEILKKIIEHGYRLEYGDTPVNSVGTILRINEKRWFECVERGVYKLVDTSVTDEFDWDEIDWDGDEDDISTSSTDWDDDEDDDKKDDEPNYKKASDFITSEVPSKDEKELLELIVNFRLPLVKGEVCFADIQDKLEIEFSDEEKSRPQSIDKSLLEKKLNELREQIAKLYVEIEIDHTLSNLYGPFLNPMMSVADEIEGLLADFRDIVVVDVRVLGEFIPGKKGVDTPMVVIYYENIQKSVKDVFRSYASWQVMPAVFVHEMFHAWNYFKAGRNSRSVLAIDEPMVEFETLYFLKQMETFTPQSHRLRKGVESVRRDREYRVHKKQQSIGDVAAYGFGYYLFKNLSDYESIRWIETYSKKSASINNSDELVEQVKDALTPIYPFQSEDMVMECFKKIIFKGQATSKTVGKSAAAKISNTMSDVIYKIRVNRPCRLFIDEEEVMTLKENELTKITLPEGEYLRKVVAEDDSTIFDEKVISLFHPKVDIIALDAISLEEAKRNALPDEIFQSNLYFKPTRDRLSVVVVGTREYVDTINIPDQIKYAGYVYPVIDVWLKYSDLKSITIPDGVKSICFEHCSSLTSIIIPDSVTLIYNDAFEDCDSLTAIDYTGTKEQWKKIMKHEFWKPLYEPLVIHCTDGDVKE